MFFGGDNDKELLQRQLVRMVDKENVDLLIVASVDGGALGKLGHVITSSKNAKTMYAIQMAGHSLEAATGLKYHDIRCILMPNKIGLNVF